jgi:hypothetical protein
MQNNLRRILRKLHRNENGTVLLWMLGLLLIATMGTSLLVSLLQLNEYKSSLQLLSDRAVLAGANRLDFSLFQETGAFTDISVDQTAARLRINEVLKNSSPPSSIQNLTINKRKISLTAVGVLALIDFRGIRINLPIEVRSSAEVGGS